MFNLSAKRLQIQNGPNEVRYVFLETLITNVGILFANMLTGIITARLLGPAGRGELAAILLWPSIIVHIGIIGTNWGLARESAKDKLGEKGIVILIRSSIVFGSIHGFLVLIISWWFVNIAVAADKSHLMNLIKLYLLFIPFSIISLNILGVYQGAWQFTKFNIIRASYYYLYLMLIMMFWIFNYVELKFFVIANLIGSILMLAVAIIISDFGNTKGKADYKVYTSVVKSSTPYAVATIFSTLCQRVDQILIISFLSSNEVGLYIVGLSFAGALSPLINTFNAIVFAQSAQDNTGERVSNISMTFRRGLFLYGLMLVGFIIVSPLLIPLLYGKAFARAISLSMILLPAMGIVALAQILDECLRGIGKPLPGTLGQMVSIILTCLVAWLTVPIFGLKGMALAALMGALAYLLMSQIFIYVYLDIPITILYRFQRNDFVFNKKFSLKSLKL